MPQPVPAVILMADDDMDDIDLVRKALKEARCNVDFRYVEDGEEAMEYLTGLGRYAEAELAPRPDLILLDFHMPKKDGLQTLIEIRKNPQIRSIPVVVLTTSRDKDLMFKIYSLGGSAFITKPTVYTDMLKAMDRLCSFWFGTVSLPGKETAVGSVSGGGDGRPQRD